LKENKPTVAIAGGGFCGTLTLIQLIRQSEIPLKIILINKEKAVAKGIAFDSFNPKHVLNVTAAKMSALPDDPDNFINWIKSKPEYSQFVNEELADSYLPRVIYGKYLDELLSDTLKNCPADISVEILNDEVKDLIPSESTADVVLKSNKSFKADKVVLALGNFIPDNPKIKNNDFYKSKNYFNNPWDKAAIENLAENKDVLIIGTGLTMVDTVLSLLDNNFNGKIFAVSTKGFFPLSHKKRKPYTDILDELKPPYEINSLYKIFRKHIKIVLSNGITGEAVVDAVRPKTQEIWLSLSLRDKIRFMAHVRHLWGVARHRLPKDIFDLMQKLIANGKLEIIAGRLIDSNEAGNEITVSIKERKTQNIRDILVQRVINCTGPKTDLNKIEDELIVNLLNRGLIVPDEMKLGINALPDGTIIQRDHSISNIIFTLGSSLKGILWESTAVPELRVQAKVMAENLLRQLGKVTKKSEKV